MSFDQQPPRYDPSPSAPTSMPTPVSSPPAHKPGFFATLPGVLTAVAALVTAVGGVYGLYVANGRANAEPAPVTSTVAVEPPPEQTPAPDEPPAETPVDPSVEVPSVPEPGLLVSDDVDALVSDPTADGSAQFGWWYDALAVDGQVVVDECLAGDGLSCDTALTMLVDGCAVADWVACDVLYYVSDIGSEYESFGATCGFAFDDWTYVGRCST